MGQQFYRQMKFDGFSDEDIEMLSPANYLNLTKQAIKMSDGIIPGERKN